MTLISLIPLWPWLVLLLFVVISSILFFSIRLNNRVWSQRQEIAYLLEYKWGDSPPSYDLTKKRLAMLRKLDSVSYFKHLLYVHQGKNWKELYYPEFFDKVD